MSDFAEARARRALTEAGLDYTMPLTRASSVTNEVWLAPEHVIRVNRRPNQRLRREAYLGPLLPPAIGYPEIVAYGGTLGADWLVMRRQPGEVLARCWPSMSNGERRSAVRQLAQILRQLHQVRRPPDLPFIDAAPQLLAEREFAVVEPLARAIDLVATMPFVDPLLAEHASRFVRTTSPVLEPFDTSRLVHGDLTFENVLWDGRAITALLDFEWARGGPCDLDLDVLLRFCAYPYLHVAPDYEDDTLARDYALVPYWLCEDYPALFEHPHQLDRVRLYCIAYDVRELLAFPPPGPADQLSPHHPVNRLDRTLRGIGHLDRLAGGLDPELPWDFTPVDGPPLSRS
ncbi:phosphotransferase family protein [Rhabdothermincola salaria]|uniref:phosphotransferase family protein n=1 Tax=Rhabdothermincola salaria TaxID=2903142 RepID=UPI001E3EE317|nr:phosphotransferase [Rhabdothermincola salaria]